MKRIAALTYGIIAYLAFLVAFIYAVGFVGNFFVPKSIDSGTDETSWKALLINVALIGVFALQHSVMARPAFKRRWIKIIDEVIERSTYVLLSSMVLFLIYWQWQPMTLVVWKTDHVIVSVIVWAIYFFGWLVVLLSTFMINHFDMFGLKQVGESTKHKLPDQNIFVTRYFYKIVRHPIMSGFIITFWATPVMTMGHLTFSVTTTVYILIAVKFLEEKDLVEVHGKQYEAYQKSVPMLFPFIKTRD